MKLDISIVNVQHIKKMQFSINLEDGSLICITGRNGLGKTTLVKALRNLTIADTFSKTSSARIFSSDSEIRYSYNDASIVFTYDNAKKTIDTRDIVPPALRKSIFVELPIPHGERFNFFQKISQVDSVLRSQIILGKYSRPNQLIKFLNTVYSSNKFDSLVEVRVRNVPYYAIVYENNYYLREDYFSSGEYFLISLYRRIISGHSLIIVDEIDISLDAAAQVRLIEWLRLFKEDYKTKFVFTTHSLPMMRMLDSSELFYMSESENGSIEVENRSYGFVKSTLFGFSGWERYILTEDDVLKDFLEYLISKHCANNFYQYKIIYVGGGTNTTDLMERNKTEGFLSKNPSDVMVVLDGDQRNKSHSKKVGVYCIPMESIEKELLARCLRGECWDPQKLRALIDDCDRLLNYLDQKVCVDQNRLKALFFKMLLAIRKSTAIRRKLSVARGEPAKDKDFKKAGKRLFKHLTHSKEMTKNEVFEFLIQKNPLEIKMLRREIEGFIGN